MPRSFLAPIDVCVNLSEDVPTRIEQAYHLRAYINKLGMRFGPSISANIKLCQMAFHRARDVEVQYMFDYVWYKRNCPYLVQISYDNLYKDLDGSISVNQNFLGD